MEEELKGMKASGAWQQLLRAIKQHNNDTRHTLAVHTSTCAQPSKEEALVPSLDEAGLRRVQKTGPGRGRSP